MSLNTQQDLLGHASKHTDDELLVQQCCKPLSKMFQ